MRKMTGKVRCVLRKKMDKFNFVPGNDRIGVE